MSLDIGLQIEVDTGGAAPHTVELFETNITHNLWSMWLKAGVYDALYMSEGMKASEVLPVLQAGYDRMLADPPTYEALNAPNGWGTYEQAMPWLKRLIDGFSQHPKGKVWICK